MSRIIGGGLLGGQAPGAAPVAAAGVGATAGAVARTGDGSVAPVDTMGSDLHPLAANTADAAMQIVLIARS
jgi:hypothetical protein